MTYGGRGAALAAAALHIGVGCVLWSRYGAEGWTSPEFGFATGALALSAALFWAFGRKYDRTLQLALRDQLTGLGNRRFIGRSLPKLLSRALRRGERLAVSMIDVNGFKQINDTFGHHAGDVLLQHIAFAISRSTRKGDLAARWGGDEFIVVSTSRGAGLRALQEQIEEKLAQLSAKHQVELSVSIGSAVFPEDGGTLEELAHAADCRMFEGKFDVKQQRQAVDVMTKIG